MKPTEHQNEKLQECLKILKKSQRLLIKGSAGVGKTTLVRFLLSHLKGKIVFSAPTHTAVGVIQQGIGKVDNATFATIHSVLQYKRIIDPNTGEKTFAPSPNPRYPPLKNVNFLIVDEASMIGVDMLKHIEDLTPAYCKVIFLGDDKQIFPVGEPFKSVFLGKPSFTQKPLLPESLVIKEHPTNPKYFVGFDAYPEVELTEIVRQGQGNPIISLSRNLSSIQEYKADLTEDKKGYFYTQNETKILEELSKVNGSTALKYLAWTNQTVDRINSLVRSHLYGKPAKVEKEEYIIFDEPYRETYVTNEFLKVEDLVVKDLPFVVTYEDNKMMNGIITQEETLRVYIINPIVIGEKNSEPEYKGVYIIHEDSETKYKSIVAKLKANAKAKLVSFVEMYNFEGLFAQFKYAHAITIHKSQGQSFDSVIVNYKDVCKNKNIEERESLLYTAVTRPRNLLIFHI